MNSDAYTGPRLSLVKAKASQCFRNTRCYSAFLLVYKPLRDRWPALITHVVMGILARISEKEMYW